MLFPRKLSLRRKSQNPQDPARAADAPDELRPKLNLSKLEVMVLMLMR